MRKSIAALITLSLVVAGCAPKYQYISLQEGAEKIKIFRKGDPPISCVEIEPFTVTSGYGCGALGAQGSFQSTYNAFKNWTQSTGGNAALLQSEIPPHSTFNCYVNAYTMNGVAYKCPETAINVGQQE